MSSIEQELYIGLMSGTSLDGIDAVLADFATAIPRILASHYLPYPVALRQRLFRIRQDQQVALPELGRLDAELGELYARCVQELLASTPYTSTDVIALGCHGQTLAHNPNGPDGFSLQIGDGNRIAHATGIATVNDFRRRDIAAGGQGAPLVPAFHRVVFHDPCENRVILNLGGIANITILPADPSLPVTGFDTGPGNTLLDYWIARHCGQTYDRDGAWAATGSVDKELLEIMLDDPYFQQPSPKSTGQEHFSPAWLQRTLELREASLLPEDIQSTLAQLTTNSIIDAIRDHAPQTQRILICGGGVGNQDLLIRLRRGLSFPCLGTDEYGIPPASVEALAFAWLARRNVQGQSGNLPSVTGASEPVVLGAFYQGAKLRSSMN